MTWNVPRLRRRQRADLAPPRRRAGRRLRRPHGRASARSAPAVRSPRRAADDHEGVAGRGDREAGDHALRLAPVLDPERRQVDPGVLGGVVEGAASRCRRRGRPASDRRTRPCRRRCPTGRRAAPTTCSYGYRGWSRTGCSGRSRSPRPRRSSRAPARSGGRRRRGSAPARSHQPSGARSRQTLEARRPQERRAVGTARARDERVVEEEERAAVPHELPIEGRSERIVRQPLPRPSLRVVPPVGGRPELVRGRVQHEVAAGGDEVDGAEPERGGGLDGDPGVVADVVGDEPSPSGPSPPTSAKTTSPMTAAAARVVGDGRSAIRLPLPGRPVERRAVREGDGAVERAVGTGRAEEARAAEHEHVGPDADDGRLRARAERRVGEPLPGQLRATPAGSEPPHPATRRASTTQSDQPIAFMPAATPATRRRFPVEPFAAVRI